MAELARGILPGGGLSSQRAESRVEAGRQLIPPARRCHGPTARESGCKNQPQPNAIKTGQASSAFVKFAGTARIVRSAAGIYRRWRRGACRVARRALFFEPTIYSRGEKANESLLDSCGLLAASLQRHDDRATGPRGRRKHRFTTLTHPASLIHRDISVQINRATSNWIFCWWT